QPDNSRAFTVQPASQPDAQPGQTAAMYFVNAVWPGGDALVVRSLATKPSLALNAPQWVGVADYNLPADAPQPGGSAIDTGDTRLLGATYRYGAIYTANTTQAVQTANYAIQAIGHALSPAPNPYANAQWYRIGVASPTSYQSPAPTYAVDDAGVAYFFPGALPGCAAGAAP